MFASYACLVCLSLLAVACGADDAQQGPREGGPFRVTLQGTTGTDGAGFELASRRVVAEGESDASVDLYLTMTMVVSLFPATEAAGLCEKSMPGATFTRVEDVPLDEATCPAEWGPAYLFGNATHETSLAAGHGYLVKDRLGTSRGRLLVISDFVRSSDQGQSALTEIVFDYLPLEP